MKKINKILILIIISFSVLIGINSIISNENNFNLKNQQNNQNIELYLEEPTPPTIVSVEFNEIEKNLYYIISIPEPSNVNVPTFLTSLKVTNGIETYAELSIKDGDIPPIGTIFLNGWNSDQDYSDVFFEVDYNFNFVIISDISISGNLEPEETKNNNILIILFSLLILILIIIISTYYIIKKNKNKTKEDILIK